MATVKARTAAHSLQRDFDCEAAAFDFDSNHLNPPRSDANDHSGPAAPGRAHDNTTAEGAGINCGMDAMDEWSAIPPPPRDDVSSDSDANDRRVDHPRSQLHRRHDDREGLGELANELDVTLDSTLFGNLSCCGEDTLHVLMDAELALASAGASGNIHLGAVDLGARNLGAGDGRVEGAGAGGDESDGGGGLAGDSGAGAPSSPRNDGREAGGSALRPSTGTSIHANDPHHPNNLPHDDDEDDHLSIGAASLLRGPLMAAKSASLAGGTAAGETPSKARDALLRSAMKAPRPPSSGGASSMETVHLTPTAAAAHGGGEGEPATPSAVRSEFLRAAGEMSGGSAGYSADFHSWNGQSHVYGAGAGNIVGAAAGSITPSAARNGFLTSARKAPPGTSHSARSGMGYGGSISGGWQGMGNAGGRAEGAPRQFGTDDDDLPLRETQHNDSNEGAQRNVGNDGAPLRETQHHHNRNNNANDLGEAPSRPRAGLIVATQKPRRRPPSLPLAANSPSAARDAFLTSPQDSVSTLGARSPTEEAALAARAAAGLGVAFGGAGLGVAPRMGGAPGAEQPHSQGMQQSASRGAEAADRGMPPGATTPSTQRRLASPPTSASPQNASPALPGSTPHAASHAGSLDGILARGERQIRDSVAAAEAVLRRTTDRPNKDNATRPATTPRRPFLRKGARKEPSALHTLNHREAVTPSAQRRSNAGSGANGTPHGADNSLAVAPSGARHPSPAEVPSDRKARLARLEQMQEDLRDDLRRREGRKEAAREERRAKAREERESMQPMERERADMVGVAHGTARAGTSRPRPSATPVQARNAATNGARSASAGRMRVENGAGVAEMTPSPVRSRVARREGAPTPSRARARSDVKPATTGARGSPGGGGAAGDGMTPSRARASSVRKAPAAEGADEEGRLAKGHGDDNDSLADVCVEGHNLRLDASEDSAAMAEAPESTPTPPPRSRPSSRPRTASAPKSRTAGTGPRKLPTSAGRTPHPTRKNKANPSSADNGNDEAKRAERKREEDEQRALLKNMRRRQEAALREAEGERERAKAWAAAEKASVQQWANEQRALIKKDRHKAANAALLATKKANRAQEMVEGSDAHADREDLRAELDEVRAALRKLKAAAGEEQRRLRETIRRHERTIGTLRSATSNAGEKGGAAGGGATAAAKAKSPNGGGGAAPRRRALSDYSSRQNARPGGPKADAHRRKSSEGGAEATTKPTEAAERTEAAEVVVGEEVVATEEVADADTLTEEPTDLWLHRRLAQLNAANNHLGAKVSSDGPQHGEDIAPEPPAGQRKPYNAADYGGSAAAKAYPAQSLSRPDRVDAVPRVVTSPSFQAAIGSDVHPPGQEAAPGKSQIFTYKNGTQKEVLPDGTTTVSFANGDRKRTYAHEKEGIVVYYYAATKTTQVTHRDGMQTYHFPNKQIENHYADGRKEITYPDGTTRMINTDGSCDTTFADGVRVVDLADGTQRVMQA